MIYTPWGHAQHVEVLDRGGIVWVSTASHGGLRISKVCALAKNVSQAAIKVGIETNEHFWFEEDCAWAVIAWELPHLWNYFFKYMSAKDNKDLQTTYLLNTITFWNPEYALDRGLVDLENLPTDRVFCPGTPSGKHCSEGRFIAKRHLSDGTVFAVVCAECGHEFWTLSEVNCNVR